jgi:hypothetical protein
VLLGYADNSGADGPARHAMGTWPPHMKRRQG